MSHTFELTELADESVLVTGMDDQLQPHKTVLYPTQWVALKARLERQSVVDDYDKAVEEFFAPLVAASEAAERRIRETTLDPAYTVILEEGSDPVQGVDRLVVTLDNDSAVVRLIESGHTDRLIWVDDKIVVRKAADPEVAVLDEPSF